MKIEFDGEALDTEIDLVVNRLRDYVVQVRFYNQPAREDLVIRGIKGSETGGMPLLVLEEFDEGTGEGNGVLREVEWETIYSIMVW